MGRERGGLQAKQENDMWDNVKFEGKAYYATGKIGQHIKTGKAIAEYERFSREGWRIWVDEDRNVYDG